jgi:hypothetical protein
MRISIYQYQSVLTIFYPQKMGTNSSITLSEDLRQLLWTNRLLGEWFSVYSIVVISCSET